MVGPRASVIRRLRRLLGPLVALAAAGGLGWALWSRREALSAFDWQVSWPALVLSALLFAVAPLVQAGVFHLLLRRLGARPALDATLAVWTRGFLARYAPSGVVGYAVRVRQRERLDADAETVWTASAYEQLVALVSGAAVAVAGFLLAGASPPVAASALLAAGVAAVVVLRRGFAGELVRRLLRRRGIAVPAPLRGREVAAGVGLNLIGWIPTAAATWLLVRGLAGDAAPGAPWLAGAYAFSWLLGFVVPVLPGGLGLRDATLAGLLARPVGLGVAAPLALALRVASTLGELVAAGLAEGLHRALRVRRSRDGRRYTSESDGVPRAPAAGQGRDRRGRRLDRA